MISTSESCIDWNHTIRIWKLSESVLWCTTYLFCVVSILPLWDKITAGVILPLAQWFSNFLRSRTAWCFFNVGVYTPGFRRTQFAQNVLKINIANKRISITHERIITQKRINKAFRIWQESCSRTTLKALAYHSLRTTDLKQRNKTTHHDSASWLNRLIIAC